MSAQEGCEKRLIELERRVVEERPRLSCQPYELVAMIRKQISEAVQEGVLAGSPREVVDLVKCSRVDRGGVFTISGGLHAERWEESGQFERVDDGARFNFNVTGSAEGGCVDLVAYNYNLAWSPLGGERLGFIRFDWNRTFIEERKILSSPPLSHVHLGRHGVVSPAPVLSPLEALDYLLWHKLVSRPSASSAR